MAAYRSVRRDTKFAKLFEVAGTLKEFMNQKDQYLVAHFLVTLWRRRTELLDQGPVALVDMFSSDSGSLE